MISKIVHVHCLSKHAIAGAINTRHTRMTNLRPPYQKDRYGSLWPCTKRRVYCVAGYVPCVVWTIQTTDSLSLLQVALMGLCKSRTKLINYCIVLNSVTKGVTHTLTLCICVCARLRVYVCAYMHECVTGIILTMGTLLANASDYICLSKWLRGSASMVQSNTLYGPVLWGEISVLRHI
jgi:hypothetical protein